MPIAAIILDFDDTLFMTEQVSFDMENEAARRLGYPPMPREVHLQTWGLPIDQAIPQRIPGINVAKFLDIHADVISEYAAAGRLDALTDHNIAALTALVKSGYGLYAVTSRHQGEVEHFLDGRHVLQRYLRSDAIFHKDRNQYHKPDPRVFDAVLAAAGTEPARCLYVGDSVSDCQAAKGAGLQFVACLESGLRHRADFTALTPPPDGYIDTFADLPAWLAARPHFVEQLIHDGDTHRNNGRGLKAVAAYRQAVHLATAAGEWSQAAAAQHMLGVAYKVENNIDAALAELHRALPLYERAANPDGAGRVARDIGIAYAYRHQYAEAEPWLKRSITELQHTANPPELGISQAKLGLHYLRTHDLAQAKTWIDRGLATIRQGHHWFYEMTTLLHRAELRLNQRRPADAVTDLRAALDLIQNAGAASSQERRLAQICGLLAQSHLRLGDLTAARLHYAQAQELLASMPQNVAAVVREDIAANELESGLFKPRPPA